VLKLIDDKMCFVCGDANKEGLRLDFQHPGPGLLKSEVVFDKKYQGYQNIVHGGMMAVVLDEMMVNLAWIEGKPSVTGELTVRLKKPAKVGETIFLEGRIIKENARVLYAKATAKDGGGELIAEAKGTCVRIDVRIDNP
jgi:uncharacterized protein (TIGR00369 family)